MTKVNLPLEVRPDASPYPGVSHSRGDRKWYAQVRYKGINYKLGGYSHPNKAIAIKVEADTVKAEEAELNPLDVTIFHRRINELIEKHKEK